MSTHPQSTPTTPTRPQTRTTSIRFTTGNAPRTFCPDNTDPCPQMFADKWTATEQ